MVYSPNKYRETEGIKVRRLGYALDAAALQQIAYDHGIQQNINTMTQAQKSQLRYIAIIQQSQNVMGDMARTIMTPANSMRILGQQMTQFQRAVGNVVSVFAVKIIPYIQVAIRLLTDFANWLAELWGFELPTIDYSSVGKGISNLTDDADAATEAVDNTSKAIQRLAGFDEINVLKSAKEDADDTANTLSNKFDLGLDLPTYDFLQGVENSTEELYQKVKAWLIDIYKWLTKHKDLIMLIAGTLASMWAVSKIKKFTSFVGSLFEGFKKLNPAVTNFFDAFKNTRNDGGSVFESLSSGLKAFRDSLSVPQKIGIGAVAGVISGFASYDFFKKLSDDTLTWKDALLDTVGVLGSIGAAFALGGPIAGTIAIIGALIGAVVALNDEIGKTFDEQVTQLFDNGGVKIADITKLFEEQYSAVNETSEKVKGYVDAIATNKAKIEDAQKEIENLTRALNGSKDALTQEDADELNSKFKLIGDGIKDNLGLATQGIIQSFSDKISDVAASIGVDLNTVIADITGFEKTLSGNVDRAQKVIEDYHNNLANGLTPTEEETKAYQQAWGYFMDKARSSSEMNDFQQAMNIDLSKIDFMSEDDFNKNLEQLTSAAEKAKNSVESTYQDTLALIDNQLAEAERQKTYGLLDNTSYQALVSQMANVKNLIKADRDRQISDIEDDYSAITGAIKGQANEVISEHQKWLTALDLGIITPDRAWDESAKRDVEKWLSAPYYEEYFGETAQEAWDRAFNSKDIVDRAERDFHNIGKAINSYAQRLDIEPNVDAGKKWLNQMVYNSQMELPHVLNEMSVTTDLIAEQLRKDERYKYIPDAELMALVRVKYAELGKNAVDGVKDGMSGFSTTIYTEMMTMFTNLKKSLGTLGELLPFEQFEGFALILNQLGNLPGGSAFGTAAKLASTSITSIISKLKIPGYATGGMPVSGDLFFANENGKAEFISSVGNRTAVANQDQMRAEMREGVREGVLEALRAQTNNGTGDVYVFIDGDEIAYRQERRQNANSIRTGGR